VSKRVLLRSAWPVVAYVALAVCATGCDGKPEQDPAANAPAAFKVTPAQRARLTIMTLARENFRPTLEITGTVAFNGDRSTQVLSSVSGPVSQLLVTLGATVTAGQPLATVSSPDFAAAVATYRKAENTLRNSTRILKLDEQLFANDALARSELDQARSDNQSALADRDAAVLALRALGIADSTISSIRDGRRAAPVLGTIVAPIPGTVVEKLINPGQIVAAGTTPAFTVADLRSVWINASVYAQDLSLVAKGVAVDIYTDASPKPVSGVVDYVAPIVDPGTKATTVRVVATNPGQVLKRDLFVRMVVHSREARSGLLVPVAAVLRDDENLPFAFVAAADGSFLRRRVTLGVRVGERYEILTGLAIGDKVVADGGLFIRFAESQ
jgi:cobalt-zinc-cadmium efflux system membrane fusion protein